MRPLVYAHRGAQTYAIENTLEAFEKAFQLGVDGIEVDVRICKTGDIIVFHDFYLRRLTGVSGLVKNRDLAFIRNLYLISQNGLAEARIPTLPEVLMLCRDYNGLVNIDVKKEIFSKNQIEKKILYFIKDLKMEERTLISSFNPVVLKAVKEENPQIKTGFIYRVRPYAWFSGSKYYDSLHPNYCLINKKHLAMAKRKGKAVHVWTIDEKEIAKELSEVVDAIITNRPEIFI